MVDSLVLTLLMIARTWIGAPPRKPTLNELNAAMVGHSPPMQDVVQISDTQLCQITEPWEWDCHDHVDNDCDGLTDYADPDCPFTPIRCSVAEW
jgi:hypothetical protein